MKKKIFIFALTLFVFFNADPAFATVKIETGDYRRDEGLIKSLEEDVEELHIYSHPELKKIAFSKGRTGCGFEIEYDGLAFGFLRTWFVQTTAQSLEECVETVVREIESRTASFIKKELEKMTPIINRRKVKIEFQEGKIFPVVTVWELMVITVIEENDFTFFFFIAGDDDPIAYANTVKEVEEWLINHVPLKRIIIKNEDVRKETIEERFAGLPIDLEYEEARLKMEKNYSKIKMN